MDTHQIKRLQRRIENWANIGTGGWCDFASGHIYEYVRSTMNRWEWTTNDGKIISIVIDTRNHYMDDFDYSCPLLCIHILLSNRKL